MRILFICSGNAGGKGILVQNQAESLCRKSIDIDFYLIKGKGIRGYLKNVRPLRRYLKTNHYDLIHAHYSFSAYVASMAGARPLVVSLMGSDVQSKAGIWILNRFFRLFYSWKNIIVKSETMKQNSGLSSAVVIANGLDINLFKPLDKKECCKKLGWEIDKCNILFAADPSRSEKNYLLTQQAVDRLNDSNIVLHSLVGIAHNEIPLWFNASDVVVLSSFYEGSPNVIKEAMACNRPIVCTDVGDVRWLFGNEPGHFIAGFSIDNFIKELNSAILYSGQNDYTKGRERIIALGLDADKVAEKIISLYQKILADKR
jgi:teichuronic acid biosynthesis glycosyltransferase TuaC